MITAPPGDRASPAHCVLNSPKLRQKLRDPARAGVQHEFRKKHRRGRNRKGLRSFRHFVRSTTGSWSLAVPKEFRQSIGKHQHEKPRMKFGRSQFPRLPPCPDDLPASQPQLSTRCRCSRILIPLSCFAFFIYCGFADQKVRQHQRQIPTGTLM